MERIWISPAILQWRASCQGWREQPEHAWSRAHVLWDHADRTIQDATTELALVDGVTALKRSLNHRIRHLIAIFDLHSIPLSTKPKGTLELLAHLGVIRPVLLRKLVAIRNAVEHQDSPPPVKSECVELSEFAWYFLRATDYASRMTPTAVGLVNPAEESDYFTFDRWGRGVKVETGADKRWAIEIDAVLPADLASSSAQPNWIPVDAKAIKRRLDTGMMEIDDSMPVDDLFVEDAAFAGTPTQAEALYRVYFKVI